VTTIARCGPAVTRLVLAAITSLAIWVPLASASEGFFGYSYTADTLPKGKGEWELWLTPRWDKGKTGKYSATDMMVGYEHGFSDRFTAAFYAQGFHMSARNAWPPDINGEAVYPDYVQSTKLALYKSELKYNFLSPYKGVGFTIVADLVYVRWFPKVDGARTNQVSFEPRFIVQKNFRDDSLVAVVNLAVESEWRQFPEDKAYENEFSITPSVGLSYRVARNLYLGAEGRYHTDILNGEKNHGDYFVGPTALFSQKKWYVSATWLRQLHGNPTWSAYEVNPVLYPNEGYHFEEDTLNELRVKLGFTF
jgi:opacity protein-like surface antigen